MNLSLFDYIPPDPCDHLPVWERIWTKEWLICHKCGAKLRPKKYVPEFTE